MKTTLYKDTHSLEQLSSEWDQLLEKSEANSLYLTWEWISAWLNCRENLVDPFVIVVEDDNNNIVGVAPYYLCHRKLANCVTYRFLQPLGDSQSGAEYPCWIAHREKQEAVYLSIVQALLAHKSLWDAVYMPNIAIWTHSGADMVEKLSNMSGASTYLRERDFSAFELPETCDELNNSMSKSWLKSQKRVNARIEKLNWKIKDYSNLRGDMLTQRLEELVALHEKRWQKMGEPGSFKSHPFLEPFMYKFAQMASENGWLSLLFLEIDGQPAAAQLGYVHNQTYHQLHEGFDNDIANGAGNFLRRKVIETCIKDRVAVYDFLGDHTEHKRRWGSKKRDGQHLLLIKHCFKNLPLTGGKFWPKGRFLKAPDYLRYKN